MVDVNQVLSYAAEQLGKPYVFGAEGPNTFDCSGLVQYVYGHFGVPLPRTSYEQAKAGTAVPYDKIQAGDLVFSQWNSEPANGHVGIAVSPTQIINAPHTGAVVRYQDLTPGYMQHVTAVRRVSDITGQPAGLLDRIGGAASSVESGIVGPLVAPLKEIAGAAASAGKLADQTMKLFVPGNFVRICAGISGAVLIVIGLVLIAREARS